MMLNLIKILKKIDDYRLKCSTDEVICIYLKL